jgi:hypothetical protein
MKYKLCMGISLLFPLFTLAQSLPYRFEKNILDSSLHPQIKATEFAFQGNYLRALEVWNSQRPLSTAPTWNAYDSTFFAESTIVPAKTYLLERTRQEDVFILNELHHNPSHRAFAASLLPELYRQGYRYLGLEALHDDSLDTRGYPTPESGYYTKEPEFGNFIREALALGFTVFGYEERETDKFDDDPWKNREIAQAQRIYHFMQGHKEGKYFIYCGAGHAFEGDNNGRGLSMAGHLSKLLQKDLFTVDQNRYAYRGPGYSHPFHALVKETSMLQHRDGRLFRGNPKSYETDLHLIQSADPLTPPLTAYRLENVKEYPVLALLKVEKDGVPVRVKEIKGTDEVLPAPAGNYTLEVWNARYEKIEDKKVRIEAEPQVKNQK